jgi:hypothetical protein
MANTMTYNFTKDSAQISCADTSNLDVGMKFISDNISLGFAVILQIIDNTNFIISCKALKTKASKDIIIEKISIEEVWEIQIVSNLFEGITEATVSLFPDDVETPINYNNGSSIFVRYNGSNYTDAGGSTAGMRSQERYPMLMIYLITYSQRNSNGALRMLSKIRQIVSRIKGYKCVKPWIIQNDMFTGEYDGEWHYVLNFQTTTYYNAGE